MDLRPKGEGSSFTIVLGFTNYIDEPVTMLDVKYRIDCLTTGRTIREFTSITPATEMEITVTSTDNAIQNDRNKREKRQLTIVANDDSDTQFVDPDPLQWWVNNTLPGRSIVP
jgi:hypothetical protein